jgi:Flp pilus assembly protein protease CpaA
LEAVYSQLLITASLIAAAYQDIRERAVTDLVWVGAAAGIALVIIFTHVSLLIVGRVTVIALITLAFARFGSIGEADAIAFIVITADPYLLSPLPALVATSVIALIHIGYLFMKRMVGKALQINIEQFRKEQSWIPKAIVREGVRTAVGRDVNTSREDVLAEAKDGDLVEVSYGVPTVAYLGIGYAAFVVYLLVFDLGAFLALP